MNSKYSPIDLNSTAGFYEEYYSQQHGNGLAAFRGSKHMDGDGLGSVLGNVFRSVAPKLAQFGKSAIRTVGKHAINLAKDALRGEDVGESAVRNLRAAGGDLLDDFQLSPPKAKKRKRSSKKQNGGTIFDQNE